MTRWLLLLLALMPFPAAALSDEAALQLFNRVRGADRAALTELQAAAEAGDAPAQFQLGRAYSHGSTILQRDDAAAARWVEKAAGQGHAEAQSNIGFLYSAGMGVPRDNEKAISWWTRAAEAGFAQAQYNLAITYLQGKLTAKDEAKAFAWMSRAAAQGPAQAQLNLGIMYARGIGTAPDLQQALAWYRKAAEQGNTTAMTNLGAMYANGEGVARDVAEALRWLRQPVARHDARAMRIHEDLCAKNPGQCEAPKHFVFEMTEPKLKIVIPDAPAMQMGPHPLGAAQPHARFMGSGADGFTISVLTPSADAGMTPMQCANSISGGLVRRYGLKPDAVVTRRTGDSTFIMLFPVRADPVVQLKAYLMSGYRGTHCIEVHLSKTILSEKEIEPWFKGFEGARIDTY